MTKVEAMKLLRKAPRDDMESAVIRGKTRRQAAQDMVQLLSTYENEEPLPAHVKRMVLKVVRNSNTNLDIGGM